MRRLAALLLLLAAAPAALAQDALEGTVRYEQTVRIDIQLPPEMAHMRDQIPESRSEDKLLLFDEAASIMKNAPAEEDEDVDVSGRGMRFRMMRNRSEDARYTNFDDGKVVERRDFLGRTFLIDGDTPELAWRLTGEQSEFLGYACYKATTTRDTVAVEAWFAPEIPVPAGPAQYGGLPGLILVLTEDDGRLSYVAEEVLLGPVAEGEIAAPTEGRRVTHEEFRAIMEEKMEEMRTRRGRGGRDGIIIRGGD